MFWIIVPGIAAVTLLLLGVQLAISRSVMRMIETAPPLNASGFGVDDRAEPLSFRTFDGLTLQACYFRQTERLSQGLILFCHEFGGSRWSAMSYCEGLFDAGFEIVSFDFRNHGSSDSQPDYDPIHWVTDFELRDVRSAVAFIESHEQLSGQSLGVFGISRGAAAALAVAAGSDRIRLVACEGAYSTRSMMGLFAQRWVPLLVPRWMASHIPAWHIELSLVCGRLYSETKRGVRYLHVEKYLKALRNCRVLLISGQQDNYVRPEIATGLKNAVSADSVDLWMVPHARHNGGRLVAPDEYDWRLTSFFSELQADKTDRLPAAASEAVPVGGMQSC